MIIRFQVAKLANNHKLQSPYRKYFLKTFTFTRKGEGIFCQPSKKSYLCHRQTKSNGKETSQCRLRCGL